MSTTLHMHLLISTAAWLGRWPTSIFSTDSTPAAEVRQLSMFVLTITGLIYLGVTALLVYALVRFRARPGDETEPPQVFGSTQIELAWTIIPILLIVMLFLGTARVVFAVQDAKEPASALDVMVVGHQFWWEFRYPKYNVVTANELHVPLSDARNPTPTYMKLISADVMHSFWVPRLAGKTDVLPNRINEMWIDPHQAGMYLGQCAQFCGPEHAKMLLRVYVDTPAQFQQWIQNQQRAQESGTGDAAPSAVKENAGNGGASANGSSAAGVPPNTPETRGKVAQIAQNSGAEPGASMEINAEQGRRVFEQEACINCHAISGTVADGRYGPDLTHLMSRDTIASGIVANNEANLLAWITDPNNIKPGALMPAMHLTDVENKQITAYLMTLR